jgi:hypothetical protein
MSKASNFIMLIGGVLILIAYVLLYTPLYDLLWKVQQPVRPNLVMPGRPAITKPLAPPITGEAKVAKPPPKPPVVTAEAYPKFVTLRDPFVVDFAFVQSEEKPKEGPAQPAEAPKPVLQLQGIFLSPGVEAAIMDDQVVNVGSLVAKGWKVAEIRYDRVILTQKGKRKVLRIKLGVE